MICREALLWRQLDHPHILPFLGVDAETFASRNALCLVSPWMERGTLKQYIASALFDPAVDRDRLVRTFFITHPSHCADVRDLSYGRLRKVSSIYMKTTWCTATSNG
jgi:hypothetical protein